MILCNFKNSNHPPFKRSQVEKTTNKQILVLFGLLVLLSVFSSFCAYVWEMKNEKLWYLGPSKWHTNRSLHYERSSLSIYWIYID